MPVSRRQFLQGASACAVAAAVPLPALAEMGPVMWSRNITPPIFEGSIGAYQGVILRDFRPINLNEVARGGLRAWAKGRGGTSSGDLVEDACRLAATCHPRITPFGTVSRIVLEGIEAGDGC